jgi:hypothetical protein
MAFASICKRGKKFQLPIVKQSDVERRHSLVAMKRKCWLKQHASFTGGRTLVRIPAKTPTILTVELRDPSRQMSGFLLQPGYERLLPNASHCSLSSSHSVIPRYVRLNWVTDKIIRLTGQSTTRNSGLIHGKDRVFYPP